MIDAYTDTLIILALIIILGVVVPILDHSKRFGAFISLRWTTLTIVLACFVGCLLDLSHLGDSVRLTMVLGSLIMAGIFIVLRSIEKWKAKGMSFGVDTIKAEYGKAKVEVSMDSDDGKVT